MNISAINANTKSNFKGNDLEEIAKSVKTVATKKLDDMEADDFNGIAQKIDSAQAGQHVAPAKYFLATLALAAASFLAAKKASLSTIKGMEGKFPLYGAVEKAGQYLNTQFGKMKKAVSPAKVQNAKTFIQKTANSALEMAENFAKTGITETDRLAHKGPIGVLYGKNAVRKLASTTIGAGAAGLTIAKRNEDENNNGIADNAEKKKSTTLGVVKEIADALPTVAAAVNLA